jgi:hypothetical protein
VTFWTSGNYKVTRQPGALEAERKQRQEEENQQMIGTEMDLSSMNRPVEAMTMALPPRQLAAGGINRDEPRGGNDGDSGGPSILRMNAMV